MMTWSNFQILGEREKTFVSKKMEETYNEIFEGGKKIFKSQVDTVMIEISFLRDTNLGHQSVFDIFAIMKNYGFSLVNIYDVYSSSDETQPLSQFDAVFRKI